MILMLTLIIGWPIYFVERLTIARLWHDNDMTRRDEASNRPMCRRPSESLRAKYILLGVSTQSEFNRVSLCFFLFYVFRERIIA